LADDFYVINLIAKDGETVTRQDQLPNPDWLVLKGSYDAQSDIRLSWVSSNGVAQSGSGLYYLYDLSHSLIGSRAIIEGFIENAIGSDTEDFIQGNEGANILYGDGTRDGKGGDDVIWGLAGNDTIYGGAGNDELSGDDGNDRIFGDAGNDYITGNAGKDYIEGGPGADTMYGGADGNDTVSYWTSSAGVKVSLTFGSATTGSGGHAEGDTIGGFNNVDGSDFRDIITDTVEGEVAFGGNANIFRGFGGNDVLNLGGGNDIGYGGDGNDTIWGGDGNDRAFGGDGHDTLNLGAGNDIGRGNAGKDVLRGEGGNDTLYGDAGDDILFPGNGRDSAYGGAGNDRIVCTGGTNKAWGGTGDDKLIAAGGTSEFWGGAGVDTFEFRVQAVGTSTTIHDFQRGRGEKLDLGALGDFDFVGRHAFSGTALEVRFETTTTGTRVFADTDGDGDADLSVVMDGLARVIASDLLLV